MLMAVQLTLQCFVLPTFPLQPSACHSPTRAKRRCEVNEGSNKCDDGEALRSVRKSLMWAGVALGDFHSLLGRYGA